MRKIGRHFTSYMGEIIIPSIFILLMGCALPQYFRKTEWTVGEVKDWYGKKYSKWDGILYQGSDKNLHHFISRVGDEWVFLNINRAELSLKEEKLYILKSSGPLGYYYVDPEKDFVKIRDF